MEEPKLRRKGALLKNEEGELVLVNESNQAYKVDEVVAYIWSICDGKTLNEVVDTFAEASNVSVEEIREPLTNLIDKLKSASLVE